MTTRVEVSKTGLRLICNVSSVPVPRPRQVFPIPDMHGAGWPFLALSSGRDSDTGALSLVVQIDEVLPGRPTDSWTMHWSGLGANGSMAASAQGTYTVGPVRSAAPYQVRLSRRDAAGMVTLYPAATLETPHYEMPESVSAAQATANSAASAAAAAQTTANTAATNAAAANTALADIAADSKLTPLEKHRARQEWDVIAAEKAGIDSQADTFAQSRTAYDAAFQALATYLNAGTAWASGVPSWLADANLATTTAIVGSTFRTTWKAYYDARTALLNAIAARAKALADAAQATGNSAASAAAAAQTTANTAATNAAAANTALADIAADSKLTPLEKHRARQEWDVIAAEKAGIDSQADTFAQSRTAYDAAFQALATYLNAGTAWASGVPSWLADANLATTTTIVGSTFRATWKAYYDARTALLNAIAARAKALADAAQTTANSALAATVAAGSDGILSRGEKPGIIIDYAGATSDHTMLVGKALACGVPYTDFSAAYGELRDYMLGLSPAYTDTTRDTSINAATWASVWNGWGTAYTAMLVRIASAAPSTVDGAASENVNVATNTSTPVVDGVARDAGKTVLLTGQTIKAENGVYEVVYTPPSGAAYNVFPTSDAFYGLDGSLEDAANAYDQASGVPNDATFAQLNSGASFVQAIYSGFTGTNLTGNVVIKVTPYCSAMDYLSATVRVSVSQDAGQTYQVAAMFNAGTSTLQTVNYPISGATGASLRVRVEAIPVNGKEGEIITDLMASAQIHSIYVAIPQAGVANWSFTRKASIANGSIWRVRVGSAYGGGHHLATVAPDSGVTLTAQDAPYEAPLGKPSSGTAHLERDADGATTWRPNRFGFPDYASGATRALTTVYQAATDGWLNVVADGDYMNEIRIFVGATNNPTTLIYYAGDNLNSYTKQASAMLPIPAGTYYKITSTPSPYERITMKFFPALT